eukprot:TRINITY_DN310_c1_g1_i1.p1 TRINITY_DN310_c1_g1~~TRINITY_DN310_c1_g1_i1.p1  ORF type:complete len:652 (+),score=140.57 TRINITY_DN310_c1_g1_i1:231-2186(+)
MLHDLVIGRALSDSKKQKGNDSDGKEVSVYWKKGKRQRGSCNPVVITNGVADFNGQSIVIEATLNRKDDDPKTSFEATNVAFSLRMSRHLSKKKLGKKVFDLGNVAKDGLNETRDLAFMGNKKSTPSLKMTVRTTWLKLNDKHIRRDAPPQAGKDRVEIDGHEYGLVTGDTISEADSSHYTGSDDEAEPGDAFDGDEDDSSKISASAPVHIRPSSAALPKGGSLKETRNQQISTSPRTVIDEWQERARTELGLAESAPEQRATAKAVSESAVPVSSENKYKRKLKRQKAKTEELRKKYEDVVREKLDLKQQLEMNALIAPQKEIHGPQQEALAVAEAEIRRLKAEIACLQSKDKRVAFNATTPVVIPEPGTEFPVADNTSSSHNKIRVTSMESTIADMERQLEEARLKKGKKSVRRKEEVSKLRKDLKDAEQREKSLASDMKRLQEESARVADSSSAVPHAPLSNPQEVIELRKRVQQQEDELKVLRMKSESLKSRSDEDLLKNIQLKASESTEKAPPLWREQEDRMQAKITRLERQLIEATDSLAQKEGDIRSIKESYEQELTAARAAADALQRADLERARAAASLSGGPTIVMGGGNGASYYGGGPGNNMLSVYVDNWVRNSGPRDASVKIWWAALGMIVLLFGLSSWW